MIFRSVWALNRSPTFLDDFSRKRDFEHLELYSRKVYDCALAYQGQVVEVAAKSKAIDTLLGDGSAIGWIGCREDRAERTRLASELASRWRRTCGCPTGRCRWLVVAVLVAMLPADARACMRLR